MEMMQTKVGLLDSHYFLESCPEDLEFGGFGDAVGCLSSGF